VCFANKHCVTVIYRYRSDRASPGPGDKACDPYSSEGDGSLGSYSLGDWVFHELEDRGENGQGTRNSYRIRVLIRDHFSDTDTSIFIFGTDTGNTRIIHLWIRSDTERVLPSKYPDIRVGYGYPEFGYPFFLFLHNNIVIKS
jgi:hypothetical protein